MENFGFSSGFVIFLTNNPGYSQGNGKGRDDEAFRIHDSRVITKNKIMRWRDPSSKTAQKKEFATPIKLKGEYTLHWKNYGKVTECPRCNFTYLLVEVSE